ncbi:hypothetical protein UFOVP136_34 [uncultured Caudovirales phage]|uniref:Uncharacterized protein n=1 Tax=uncultured Caudovirales phage TaxID=2100421 RepID=A0A6J5LDN4_9CAUD|nr:hypothetical protein UFOVP136_34 [uncultured Caudovirales phage]
MAFALTLDPMATNAAGDLARIQSDGLFQGQVLVNPYTNAGLDAGIIASTETYPLYAGLPVSLGIDTLDAKRGNVVRKSVVGGVAAGIQGFTVSQNAGVMGFQTPTSPVPLFPQGSSINFYPLGSKARIVVQIDNTLAATFDGTILINTPVRWDFTNDKLVAWVSGTDAANLQITGIRIIQVALATTSQNRAIAYNTGTGLATWDTTKSLAVIEI